MDKKRASLLSQESENLNVSTFTKSSKPKRVESFIKKIEKNLWRRKDPKEPSPAPSSSHSTSDREGSTIKRSKNIFKDFISSGKKSTREVEVQCKMDEDKDYYSGIATRRSSTQVNASPENKKTPLRPLKASQRHENGNNPRLTSIIKSSADRSRNKQRDYPYNNDSDNVTNIINNNSKKSSTPAPIRVEIDLRNAHNNNGNNKTNNNRSTDLNLRKPIGIASPLPQPKSVLKSGTAKSYENKKAYAAAAAATTPNKLAVENTFGREGSDRISFREYREQLRAKQENKKMTDNSEDDLRRSYQQTFFVPM